MIPKGRSSGNTSLWFRKTSTVTSTLDILVLSHQTIISNLFNQLKSKSHNVFKLKIKSMAILLFNMQERIRQAKFNLIMKIVYHWFCLKLTVTRRYSRSKSLSSRIPLMWSNHKSRIARPSPSFLIRNTFSRLREAFSKWSSKMKASRKNTRYLAASLTKVAMLDQILRPNR